MPLKWGYNKNLGYFWNLHIPNYLLVPKKHVKSEICGHSDKKNPKKIVRFDQKLVPFLLLGQLNHLKIGLDSKNGVVLESTHFDLSTGAKKSQKC